MIIVKFSQTAVKSDSTNYEWKTARVILLGKIILHETVITHGRKSRSMTKLDPAGQLG